MNAATRSASLDDVFVIPLDDNARLVYAPLHGVAFAGTAGLVDALSGILAGRQNDDPAGAPDDMVRFARELGLLEPVQRPVTVRSGDPEPTDLTLFLTTACNLRCTYCYASAGDAPATYMSIDTARRGIDFVIANARRRRAPHIGLNFHGGGEPTVHWKLMTEALAYAREQAGDDLKVIAAAASNGVLTDAQISWITAELNGGVSLSFDGLPDAHDRHRPTVRGTGSSERVMHTMRRFDEAGYPYAVRVTVTADQIPILPESVDFLLGTFRPLRVQVEPAYQLGRHLGEPSAETTGFIEAYREAQARAAVHGHELLYSAARVGHLSNHFCGITQDNFCLTPGGTVSACYESFDESNEFADVFQYGRSDGDGFTFDLPVLQGLRDLGVEQRSFCDGCFARWNCAGDCYHKSLAANGRGEFAGSERCHITRELVKDQLLTRIADSGGLVWRDPQRQKPCVVHGHHDDRTEGEG